MKVKVRKKSAPAVECGKRTNKAVSAPFLIGDICGYRHRTPYMYGKLPELAKRQATLRRRIQSFLKRF